MQNVPSQKEHKSTLKNKQINPLKKKPKRYKSTLKNKQINPLKKKPKRYILRN